MNRQAIQLIARGAINKIGNMLYDYGNNIWLVSLGSIGQTILGIYQTTDLLTSILFNPIGGAIVDRFSRRKVLMTTDLVCASLCLFISFITDDKIMIAALVFANIVQAIAFAFSRPANKSYITEIVEKEDIVTYNSHLEMALQVISVSAPLLSFFVMHFGNLRITLLLDALSFFLAFVLVYFLPHHQIEKKTSPLSVVNVLKDIKAGFTYIRQEKEIFFLLLVASSVNFFFAAFNYLLPFTDKLFRQEGFYATLLTLGAIGSIIGALIANKIPATMKNLLNALLLTGVGVFLVGVMTFFPLSSYFAYGGNFICELFMTVFNIHFFSQVQTRVDKNYLGRVLSTIFTLAILFMPLATFLMTVLPSVHLFSFCIIGLGVVVLSVFSKLYQARKRTTHS
ncbi:MAG: MFS transporter [Streptococcus sp.]|nr:MFS transporter [Streptococcus sp.]